MDIDSTTTDTLYQVFYKDEFLEEGKNITFSVWNEAGQNILTNAPMTFEIFETGVYTLEITTPSSPGYLLTIGTDGTKPKGHTLEVGTPLKRSFYLNGDFQEGLVINYTIFDTAGAEIQAGQMTNVAGGFYSVVTDGLPEPWFLEVNQLIANDR